MSVKHRVLVVDDEPMNREILEEILEPDYEVTLAESGSECLEMVAKTHPRIILLDINMPGMSGYEVCNKLKSNADTSNIPVTFVSALDTLAERLAGYEAGADDYITKPFDSQELLSKVKVVIQNQQKQDELKNDASYAMNTAMTAMTSTSELGVVLQFLRASFGCRDLKQLADKVIEALAQYGLRSTIQLRVNGDTVNRSSDGTVNQLETTVIARIFQENRIIDIGPRTIFNYDHVSILAKGMPLSDSDKCGRLKDHLALLAEGCEERVVAILTEMELTRKQYGLAMMVKNTQQALAEVDKKHDEHKVLCVRILTDLIVDAESSFSVLGLSETQEKSFMEMINKAVAATIDLYNEGLDIDGHLRDVMSNVQDMMVSNVQ